MSQPEKISLRVKETQLDPNRDGIVMVTATLGSNPDVLIYHTTVQNAPKVGEYLNLDIENTHET